MKNFCKMFFMLFLFFGISHANESNYSTVRPAFSKCEKMYIQPDQVAITPEGIYFQFDNSWVMTDAVHYDSAGLFVSSTSNEWSFKWECPKCHHFNGPFSRSCEKCGYTPRN